MRIIFCSDPINTTTVDEAYAVEGKSALDAQLQTALLDYEALVNEKDVQRALRRIPKALPAELGIYRGWMLKPPVYSQLHEALGACGIRLINDPAAYVYCHHLPSWYSDFTDITPKTVVIPLAGEPDLGTLREAVRAFGRSPIILKDYVKSQKHYWKEACFIPDASDTASVERVTRRFLQLQGDSLVGGLVFREFIDLEPIGLHPKSGMPLTREFRLFYFDSRPLHSLPYWEHGDYGGAIPPLDQFSEAASRVKSRFFTMDVAKTKRGNWILIELGDGQVAGLPDNADVDKFYRALREELEKGPPL
jgi:hypothetical protein